jgi:short-subunit dehydrogenase
LDDTVSAMTLGSVPRPVLVNNAGFGLYGAVEDISVDEAGYQFGMKVSDPVRLTQLVLPAMLVKGVGA